MGFFEFYLKLTLSAFSYWELAEVLKIILTSPFLPDLPQEVSRVIELSDDSLGRMNQIP